MYLNEFERILKTVMCVLRYGKRIADIKECKEHAIQNK